MNEWTVSFIYADSRNGYQLQSIMHNIMHATIQRSHRRKETKNVWCVWWNVRLEADMTETVDEWTLKGDVVSWGGLSLLISHTHWTVWVQHRHSTMSYTILVAWMQKAIDQTLQGIRHSRLCKVTRSDEASRTAGCLSTHQFVMFAPFALFHDAHS